MNGCLLAIVGLVALFAVGEVVGPRLVAVLGRGLSRLVALIPTPAPAPAKSKTNLTSSAVASEAAVTPTATETVSDSADEVRAPEDPVVRPRRAAADQLWAEARALPHGFIPDPKWDAEYMAKLCGAARLGLFDAMLKLGEYAFRRGAIVEAYYWMALADLKGAGGLEIPLRKMRTAWLAKGRPAQHENVYEGFTEQQGKFARTLLCLRSSINIDEVRARMQELAADGCEEAVLSLSRESVSECRML